MTYIINVEEKISKEPITKKDFCNIISTKEGTINKIIATSGTPLVEINEHVNVGDTLITGEITYNNELKGLTCAEGNVYAKTWYTVNISIPKKYHITKKTDNYKRNIKVDINDKTYKLFKNKIKNSKIESKTLLNLFNIKITSIKEYETKTITKEYTESEIENKIQELIKEKLKPLLKDNNHILEQKVLKKNNFNSTIEVEIFVILEEQIGKTIYQVEEDDQNE